MTTWVMQAFAANHYGEGRFRGWIEGAAVVAAVVAAIWIGSAIF